MGKHASFFRPTISRDGLAPWLAGAAICAVTAVAATPPHGTEFDVAHLLTIAGSVLAFLYVLFILWDSAETAFRYSIARHDGDHEPSIEARNIFPWLETVSLAGWIGAFVIFGGGDFRYAPPCAMALAFAVALLYVVREAYVIWRLGEGSPEWVAPTPTPHDEHAQRLIASTQVGFVMTRSKLPVVAVISACAWAAVLYGVWTGSSGLATVGFGYVAWIISSQLWVLWFDALSKRESWSEAREDDYCPFDFAKDKIRNAAGVSYGLGIFLVFLRGAPLPLHILAVINAAAFATYLVAWPIYLLNRFDPVHQKASVAFE
jgi:hypothetical protein